MPCHSAPEADKSPVISSTAIVGWRLIRQDAAAFVSDLRVPDLRLPIRHLTLFSLCGAVVLAFSGWPSDSFAAEPAKKVEILYDLSVAGFGVGTGTISIDFNGSAYSSKVTSEVTGIASLFFQTKILAEGDGVLRSRRVLPNRYHLDIKDSRAYQIVEMAMSEGDVQALVLDPPLMPRADRIPVQADHKRNIVDPVGGVIVPRRIAKPFEPENCNQTLSVFDGAGRFDLNMQQGRAGKVTVEGYSGQVLVCAIKYKPVSGHRRRAEGAKKPEGDGKIEVKLAPIAGRPYYIPLEVSVPVGPGQLKLVARTATGLAADLPATGDFAPDE